MELRDSIDKEILALIDRKLTGTGIPLEQFVEEALLTKLSAPSHRTLKIETLIRIWDTAVKYGEENGFKEKFLHFHFGIRIYKTDDPYPWDETDPYTGPNPPLEDKKFIQELIDLRKPEPPPPRRPENLDFFLE